MVSRRTDGSHAAERHPERAAAVEISVEEAAGLRLVSVQGELDLSTAVQLDAVLDTARAEQLDLVIDLRRTDFVDCAGIHSLAATAAIQARAGRTFAITCTAGSPAARLFKMLATSGVALPVYHSRADALLAALTSTVTGREAAPQPRR